jgi:hypothetical protein
MPNVRRSVIKVRRRTVVAWGLGVLVITAGLAVLDLWQNRTHAAARAQSEYRAATEALARLKRDWNRSIEELARTNGVIAWKEARIEETNEITADLKRQTAQPETRPLDDVVVGFCEVCITEENMDLANARRRRAQIAAEKLQIEQQIAAHEAAIRQLVAAADAKE